MSERTLHGFELPLVQRRIIELRPLRRRVEHLENLADSPGPRGTPAKQVVENRRPPLERGILKKGG